jgi:hypothetical protein
MHAALKLKKLPEPERLKICSMAALNIFAMAKASSQGLNNLREIAILV